MKFKVESNELELEATFDFDTMTITWSNHPLKGKFYIKNNVPYVVNNTGDYICRSWDKNFHENFQKEYFKLRRKYRFFTKRNGL